MRLKITKTKANTSLYVIKSTFVNGKHSSKVVEKLGTYDDLKITLKGEDPIEWAKKYISELNKQKIKKEEDIIIKFSQSKQITKDNPVLFNGGYLFLQNIYYKLGINHICSQIRDKYKFKYDLNSILSRLIYGRIIFPASKLSTCELSSKFIEQPNFEIQHVYRALEIISKENDHIQSELYKNSLKLSKRNTGILYYDCTNFFFEIEQEEGIKQYGKSKENRPNPLVQMGLFLDGDGIPLTFNITPGNTNEQITLKPTEEKILRDFKVSKFIVCTDAGLASMQNRKFNDAKDRAFITTQSIKKLKKFLLDWTLNPDGWALPGSNQKFNISKLEETEKSKELYNDKVFYKERWIKEDNLEQRLIITFSFKYKNYQQNIRQSQIDRAQKLMNSNPKKIGKAKQNDFKRFISTVNVTQNGEIAEETIYNINENLINEEARFDGFYGVCTNLEDDISQIIKINNRRWEIEESFRIMKSEFKSRPVYLSRDDRIKAHFTTCFLALTIYRYLEKELKNKYTIHQILTTLKDMNFKESIGDGYIPTYTRTDITDALHERFGFRTDFEILSYKKIKNLCKVTKK